MYTKNVFKKIKEVISDEEILDEIHDIFHLYHGKSFVNLFAPKGIIESAASVSIAERIAAFPSEEAIVESIIHTYGRPALFVQDDTFEEPVSDVWKKRLNPNRQKLESAIKAVGRVEVENHAWAEWLGTGWMVKPDIMVTNRHVAAEFARKNGESFTFKTNHAGKKISALLDFKEEYQVDKEKEINVKKVLWISENHEPDMAILQVEGQHGYIELLEESIDGAVVAVIGYPAFDSRNGIHHMNRIFSNTYDVKRFQPGFKKYDDTEYTFTHDCSTLGGNSGSPLIDVNTGKAVGLHFAGRYLKSNYAVKGQYIIRKLNEIIN